MTFVLSSGRIAKRYLTKRGLARPTIPWDKIKSTRHQAAKCHRLGRK